MDEQAKAAPYRPSSLGMLGNMLRDPFNRTSRRRAPYSPGLAGDQAVVHMAGGSAQMPSAGGPPMMMMVHVPGWYPGAVSQDLVPAEVKATLR